MTTTNYIDTFIQVAEDCPALIAEIPPVKGKQKTVAQMQYEMIKKNPYKFTSDEVLFSIHAQRNDISEKSFETEKDAFFSKGQACFRSSPLAKRYGWGVHSDSKGRIAIYAVESEEYKRLLDDSKLKRVKAMKSKRQ